MITYRFSKEGDEALIDDLICNRFGKRDVLQNINGRYLLAIESNIVVAITGLSKSPAYNGLEIDWTCVRNGYEGRGLITTMISRLIEEHKDYTGPIYCSCWRTSGNIHLRHAMMVNGFKPAILEHKKFDVRFNNCSNICVKCSGDTCHCYEDLYVRNYDEQ